MKWLAVLDMDGTLLEHRTVDVLCEKLGLSTNLAEIDRISKNLRAYEVSLKIAKLFSGFSAAKLEEIFDTIPVVKGAKDFVNFLESREFVTAIVTDSYEFLASRLAKKLGVDIVRGNKLEIRNGIVTGKIIMPMGWEKEKQPNCQRKSVCKLHVMNELLNKYSIKSNRTLAVGDSKSDLCIIRKAKIGVAFRPKDEDIVNVAAIVEHSDFYELIGKLKTFLESNGN
jgi:phosphoserine phosphatase